MQDVPIRKLGKTSSQNFLNAGTPPVGAAPAGPNQWFAPAPTVRGPPHSNPMRSTGTVCGKKAAHAQAEQSEMPLSCELGKDHTVCPAGRFLGLQHVSK